MLTLPHPRAQSAAWDDNGVLIYTTLNHIKYCLPNGDHGIIRTLDVPVYITKVSNQVLYALDREGKNRQIQVRSQGPGGQGGDGCVGAGEDRAQAELPSCSWHYGSLFAAPRYTEIQDYDCSNFIIIADA